MKVYHIVISMLVILAILFIFAPKFRRWEQKNSKLEIEYYEKLRSYLNSNKEDEKLFSSILDLAKDRYKTEDSEILKSQVENDLSNFEALK